MALGHWTGGGCQQSQNNPLNRALTQLAGHNATAGCWQGASQTAPLVCPGGQAELAF